jgi:regulator of protease activity HflC (stomatin/prohibitin superfamily)
MLILKTLLLVVSAVLVAVGALMVVVPIQQRRNRADGAPAPKVPWGRAGRWSFLAFALALAASSIVVVPFGKAGVRVSQLGTRPVLLRPGLRFVLPLLHDVTLYESRDQIISTEKIDPKSKLREPLVAHSREGLGVGLVIDVRYRLDIAKLPEIHTQVGSAVAERVLPIAASVFRDILPSYMVREIFAAKRDEIRQQALGTLTQKLQGDGIIVTDVAVREVVLPPEYAKGLEGLLLKQQENERMVFELQIKEKEVRAAELRAQAQKAQQVKLAEADAETLLLKAKAEADAMQHTLPLKEKQIQQTRLEAEARKEATLRNAEAAAQAKVIDSRAEQERLRLMADAEANRIRVTGVADAERMQREAEVIQGNPLLIQKIVAERLSDKMQIMMVPMDGSNFFAQDVFKAVNPARGSAAANQEPAAEAAKRTRTARK